MSGSTPLFCPESEPRARARGLLTWILGDDGSDIEDRLAAGDALAALQDHVPAGLALAPAPEVHGSIADAWGLLEEARGCETTPRGIIAVALAQRHLRRVAPPPSR